MAEAQYPIQLVARMTGLSAHVIRIWEQRYRAVQPSRTSANRRLYSQQDIERLNLLRDLTHAGHKIGQVAQLPTEELARLAAASAGLELRAIRIKTGTPADVPFLDECVTAIKAFDAHALENTLKRGAAALGGWGLLLRVIAPLSQTLGELWREGTFTAAHEHFATAVIRVFLANVGKSFGAPDNAPGLVVATPTGQVHELGALLVAAAAGCLGWRVTYLGASLPAAEIAGAVRQSRARAVALSLVYPEDDSRLEGELIRLRDLLPPEVAILVGGRAMAAYSEVLKRIGAVRIGDLAQLGAKLDELGRNPEKVQS